MARHKRLCVFFQALLIYLLPFHSYLQARTHMEMLIDQAVQKESFSSEMASILEQGKKDEKYLIQLAGDEKQSWKKRWVAAMALGHIHSHSSKASLEKLTRSPIYTLREAAYRGLMNHKNTSQSRVLCLEDPALPVRSACVDMIVEKKETQATEAMARSLFSEINFRKGNSLSIREKIIWALGELGDQEVTDDLMKVFEEKVQTPSLKNRTCESLQKIHSLKADSKTESCENFWRDWYKKQASQTLS